jgi:DNA-binding MarR family transcriptional regulator
VISGTIPGVAATDEAHVIAGLLFGVTERTRANFEEMCAEFGLTPVQARALWALEEPVPMRALAEELRCDPSNVTGLADRLEARGVVAREPAPEDRRVKRLVLTAEGERLRRELEAALLRTSPFMARLTAAERRTLRTLLAKMLG